MRSMIYFDSAATTQKPKIVIDEITRFYSEEYGTVHRAVYDSCLKATEKYEAARRRIKSFLNADEVIFTKGTTDAINLVASSFISEGDEVLISEMEHHSNIVPWQLRKAKLLVVPIDDKGEIILSEFKKKITKNTKLVSIAHIANATGTQNPIEEIIAIAHANGAKALIDGAQSAPHIPVDLQKLDCDFFAFSGHKIYGPTGIGVLSAKKELLEQMPPYQGGGDMVDKVTFEKTTFQPSPLKFEAGTPHIAGVIGLGVAIKYVQEIGLETIAAKEQELLHYATQKLTDLVTIIGTAQKKGAIITFIIPGIHPLDIGSFLNLKGIAVRTGHLCAQPTMARFGITGAVRISFSFTNTFAEIDILVASLQEAISLLR